MYLIPRSIGEHASKEGVHVTSVHGLAVLLDALSISKNQALPQQGITLPELICDLPAGGTQLGTDPRSDCGDQPFAEVCMSDATQSCRALGAFVGM